LSSFEISEQVQMAITQYCNFSADLARPRQRSVRVNGLATCLRLEEVYWTIIEKLAREESLSVGKLISRWALEMDLAHEDVWNFTGYVRVICVVQLMKRAGSMPGHGSDATPGIAARDVQ
jgi:predicted DNA-binding ribbon-helix-helix protein